MLLPGAKVYTVATWIHDTILSGLPGISDRLENATRSLKQLPEEHPLSGTTMELATRISDTPPWMNFPLYRVHPHTEVQYKVNVTEWNSLWWSTTWIKDSPGSHFLNTWVFNPLNHVMLFHDKDHSITTELIGWCRDRALLRMRTLGTFPTCGLRYTQDMTRLYPWAASADTHTQEITVLHPSTVAQADLIEIPRVWHITHQERSHVTYSGTLTSSGISLTVDQFLHCIRRFNGIHEPLYNWIPASAHGPLLQCRRNDGEVMPFFGELRARDGRLELVVDGARTATLEFLVPIFEYALTWCSHDPKARTFLERTRYVKEASTAETAPPPHSPLRDPWDVSRFLEAAHIDSMYTLKWYSNQPDARDAAAGTRAMDSLLASTYTGTIHENRMQRVQTHLNGCSISSLDANLSLLQAKYACFIYIVHCERGLLRASAPNVWGRPVVVFYIDEHRHIAQLLPHDDSTAHQMWSRDSTLSVQLDTLDAAVRGVVIDGQTLSRRVWVDLR
jgi:hypothetical protein